jgi:hypothetical protein
MDLRHHYERQAPGRDFKRTPGGQIQIGKELIVVEGAELGAQSHVEVSSRERGLYGGQCRLGNRW